MAQACHECHAGVARGWCPTEARALPRWAWHRWLAGEAATCWHPSKQALTGHHCLCCRAGRQVDRQRRREAGQAVRQTSPAVVGRPRPGWAAPPHPSPQPGQGEGRGRGRGRGRGQGQGTAAHTSPRCPAGPSCHQLPVL